MERGVLGVCWLGALLLGLGACSSPARGRPIPDGPVEKSEALELEEHFVLGVGVPSDLHVRLHHKEGYSDVSEEAVTVLEAACPKARCVAEITNDGAIRVLASEDGHLDLTVRTRAADGRVHAETFDLDAVQMRLEVMFDPARSRGAADGVAAGATVTWYSMVDELKAGQSSSPELKPSPIEPTFVVTMGEASIVTERGAPFYLYNRPAAYLREHTITFPSPGHVRLLAGFGAHRKVIDVDVVDTANVTAVDIRRQPQRERSIAEAIDVAASAGYFDEPPISTLSLDYPSGSATLVVTIQDSDGRRAVGGTPVLGLDVGSVVSVAPHEHDSAGGTFFVMARTLGTSTVRARLGDATTSFRAEVK